jgi:hypothetical protein
MAVALGQRPRKAFTEIAPNDQRPDAISASTSGDARHPIRSGSFGGVVRPVLYVLAAVVVTLFAIFVWPTAYRYDHFQIDNNRFPVRTHRWSGMAEILLPREGITGVDRLRWIGPVDQELPTNAVLSLQDDLVNLRVQNGSLTADLFNPTGWTITKLSWSITSQGVSRAFESEVSIAPHSWASVSLSFGPYSEAASARLLQAWGAPPP